MHRREFIRRGAVVAAVPGVWGVAGPARAAGGSVVIAWNAALKSAIQATAMQATISSRAIAMVYEAVYNAWAAYDGVASFTLAYQSRRPAGERSDTWKGIAISHAAYTVLLDLFPAQKSLFDSTLAAQVPASLALQAPGQAALAQGQGAGKALLAARWYDGSNQLGNLAAGAYGDWTGYASVNSPDWIADPARWQPLRVPTSAGGTVVQKFLTPHWGRVRPFALASGSQFRPFKAVLGPSQAEIDEVLNFNANLNDTTKSAVHYWAANPGTVSPPGQWLEIAEVVSAYDFNTLDEDVKLFFGVGQAVLDAGIAAWDCKRFYDSVRPITTVRYHYRGQSILAWGGNGRGTQWVAGEAWMPYQRTTNPTPPFPEYVSGHSTFSRAAAAVISGLRGADTIPLTFTVAANEIAFDANTPAAPVTFSYRTLSEAAQAAGKSRLYGGIHFSAANVDGRALGYNVGYAVVSKARLLFQGK